MPDELYSEKPFAIIGDEDIVIGFKALGFKVYTLGAPEGFGVVLDEAVSQQPAVCLVQDHIYRAEEARINSYRNLPLPVFIPFSKGAKTDLLDKILKEIRLKATGTF